ncbi:MAG: flippase [Patescibacteria group bacterium]|jgi:O-antigen/teichoic acid export membrane protein
MPGKVANIAKNTSYFTVALILQKVISFSYFIILARYLGPEDLGKYYFAISFTTIFSIIIDLGFAGVLIREVAKDNAKAEKFLGSILAMKIPLTAVSFAAAAILINALGYPDITKYLVYLSMLCMAMDSFTLSFFSTIRGFHNLAYESAGSVIFQLIVIGAGAALVKAGAGLKWMFLPLIAASAFNFFYSMYLVAIKWKIKIRPDWDFSRIKYIVGISIAFTLYGVLNRVYTFLDSVLLSLLSGDRAVGIYQVAFKMIIALQFLPMAFAASLYPALSLYWIKNKSQLSVTFERAMNYLIIISVPISAGIIMIADKIVLIFKSGYSEAILPLQITIAQLLFTFVNFPIGSLLNACDRQKQNTYIMGVVALTSAVLNLILIPRIGVIGASIASSVSGVIQVSLGMIMVKKIIDYRLRKNLIILAKSLFSAGMMALAVYYFKVDLNIFIVSALGAAVYFAVLFLLGGLKKEDVMSILESFRKKAEIESENHL